LDSGGRVEREYGLGRGRTDLLVIWPFSGGVQRAVIELKALHKSRAKTVQEGLGQVQAYADRCGSKEAHLVLLHPPVARPITAERPSLDSLPRARMPARACMRAHSDNSAASPDGLAHKRGEREPSRNPRQGQPSQLMGLPRRCCR